MIRDLSSRPSGVIRRVLPEMLAVKNTCCAALVEAAPSGVMEMAEEDSVSWPFFEK
jgi:hypothetical protein